VIARVSFSVAAGERVALIGLNGSGKTTLLLTAVGLVPYEGEIRVAGIPVSRRTVAQVRERIGFLFNVPEDQLLFPKVIEDAAFGLVRRGMAARQAFEKARQILDVLGAASLAETPLHHLSHGQKQRVALAGALATDPSLLLLDEPSAGLDPPGKRALARLLSGLGAAMLVATHDLDFAARLCTRFVMLADGTVVLDGADLLPVLDRWQMNELP
jgi:cobalt/nickel transport system ATP-binding protein